MLNVKCKYQFGQASVSGKFATHLSFFIVLDRLGLIGPFLVLQFSSYVDGTYIEPTQGSIYQEYPE